MVTVTFTTPVPKAPVNAGLVTVIALAVSLVIVAATPPKSTAVAFARSVPVIVTEVPPLVGPVAGLTPVTAGAAT